MTDSKFKGTYELRVHNVDLRDRPFELVHDITYTSDEGRVITAQAGYRTDFASVPRFFHRVVNPVGRHGKAAIIHDWLCDESPHTCDHKTAAHIFDTAMRDLGVSWLRRKLMVAAVLIGGPKFNQETPPS